MDSEDPEATGCTEDADASGTGPSGSPGEVCATSIDGARCGFEAFSSSGSGDFREFITAGPFFDASPDATSLSFGAEEAAAVCNAAIAVLKSGGHSVAFA